MQELFDLYKENGIKLIKSAVLDDNKAIENFLKKELKNNKFNKFQKEVIIELIKNAHDENYVNNILKVFNSSELTNNDYKDILGLVIKTKGVSLVKKLYDDITGFKNII